MTDISSLLVSAICGGLGGALFNIVWASWRAPRLRVEFGTNVEGCTVPDVPYKRGPFEGTRKYLRLKVKNGGLSTAHDVQVIIQGFEFSNYPPFAGEVLDVLWSSAPTPTIKTSIPSRTFRFADICAADDAADSEGFELCAQGNLFQLQHVKPNGVISLKLSVSASNAKTETRRSGFNSTDRRRACKSCLNQRES